MCIVIYLVTTCTNMNGDLIRDKGHETSAVGTTPESAMLFWKHELKI